MSKVGRRREKEVVDGGGNLVLIVSNEYIYNFDERGYHFNNKSE